MNRYNSLAGKLKDVKYEQRLPGAASARVE